MGEDCGTPAKGWANVWRSHACGQERFPKNDFRQSGSGMARSWRSGSRPSFNLANVDLDSTIARLFGVKISIEMGHGGCNPPPQSRPTGGEVGELVVDETQEEFLGGVVVEALDDLDGETAGDELAGADGIDAAGLEIEDFLVVDL